MASTQGQFVTRLRRVYGVQVKTRRQWGSRYGYIYARRLITHRAKVPADTCVGHITVTPDNSNLPSQFVAAMQLLERIGYQRFRSGISYNICIDRTTGMVGMGMPLRAKGTHTVNDKKVPGYSRDQNYWARAIAWIGMPGDEISTYSEGVWVKVLACLMDCGHLTEDPDFDPHSKFAYKDCPTDELRRHMPSILRRAKRLHQENKNVRTPRK